MSNLIKAKTITTYVLPDGREFPTRMNAVFQLLKDEIKKYSDRNPGIFFSKTTDHFLLMLKSQAQAFYEILEELIEAERLNSITPTSNQNLRGPDNV